MIVGIHGVGSPQPGSVVSEIVDGFKTGVFVEQGSTLRIEGQSYRQATIPETRIIEANWADLKHFPRYRLGRLLYVLKIFIAMWQISDAGWRKKSNGQAGPLLPGKVLRFYLAAFGFFLAPVSIMIMFAFVLRTKTALPVIITITLLLFGIAIWLSKFDRLILAGLAVIAAGSAASLCIIFLPDLKEDIVVGVVLAARFAQTLGVIAMVLAIASLVWRKFRYGKKEGDTWTTFASRSAFLILPFALITGGYGAVVSASGLWAVGKLSDHWITGDAAKRVGDLYCAHVGMNVAFMELVNGLTAFVVGSILVLGIIMCLLASKFPEPKTGPKTERWHVGRWAQNVVLVFLWLVFVGFFVVLGAEILEHYFFHLQAGGKDFCGLQGVLALQWLRFAKDFIPPGNDLMSIYVASSLRLVPWLGLLIGPLVRVTNIVADVLFYVLPRDRNFKLSIAAAVETRFKTLLQNIPLADTIVVAYSQGTIVAHAVICEMKTALPLFITAGSPLSSLYHRFLNIKPQPLQGPSKWINFYRLSDYVAGKVEVGGVDNHVITSHYELCHFNYFEEADIIDAVGKAAVIIGKYRTGEENLKTSP